MFRHGEPTPKRLELQINRFKGRWGSHPLQIRLGLCRNSSPPTFVDDGQTRPIRLLPPAQIVLEPRFQMRGESSEVLRLQGPKSVLSRAERRGVQEGLNFLALGVKASPQRAVLVKAFPTPAAPTFVDPSQTGIDHVRPWTLAAHGQSPGLRNVIDGQDIMQSCLFEF